MKHLFFLLTLLCANLFSLQAQNKTAALLITHYGSSDAETRTRTLDVITREAQAAFPHLEVREAYISPIVRKRMARQGVHKDSPLEALLKLRAEGFDTVYVQSTTLIEGGEMTSVRHDAASVSQFFRKIEVGNPLLYSTADCRKVISILTDNQPTGKNEAIVYIGHGNQLPSTATYAMLDYMLKADGKNHIHVSTIEGYPDLTATTRQLKESQARKVTLVPLLLVCGNHTKEDIAGVWKDALEKEGYTVSVLMRGLGELRPIRSIFLEHIADMLAD
ncbi:sirohydrochlorin cobaltochelatase [Mediterranea massiliensis]|uniref:sirohydrochlorin cobaltochelatase n=1 Tax=Mediterranea massiliensis TaxID=1841865 RepID=UPI0025A47EDC|nr:sirohydrochlorin cobaltochelatase [Mediterranea massiliensis]MDM8336350.1 sirohydrochlorin cobaltochelatase [Mediterranea massiliensis]